MKIIYVTHYTELYGANKSLLEMVSNLKKIYNITPIIITPAVGEINKKLTKMGIENYNFRYYYWRYFKQSNKFKTLLKYFIYKLNNYFSLFRMKLKFKNYNISLIHTNSSCIDIGAKLAELLNVKHIWHIREFGEEDYNLYFYKGNKRACKFIEDKSENIIFISEILKKSYYDYFTCKNKLRVIYNGIDEKKYISKDDNKCYDDKLNIIFTGLICKEKNQFELIKSIDILVNIDKIKNIKVYLLGDGNKEYIKDMKDFIYSRNLDDNINFVGRVENVDEYIKKCHIGVISSFKEAFGRVTIEYMLGGLAVIASNTGANPEIIDDGKDGLIYNLGDIKQLSEKIKYLYNNKNIMQVISLNGKNKAKQKFVSRINCEKIYNLYIEK